MKRNMKIKAVGLVLCLALFVWAYWRHRAQPMEVSNPPVIIVPKQPDVPAHGMSAEETERLDKLKAEVNARLEQKNKSGKVPPPDPELPPK